MKGIVCYAEWAPKPEYKLDEYEKTTHKSKDSSKVWKNPQLKYETSLPVPELADDEVLIKVKACGICGSDIHCLQTFEDGYMMFPGHGRMNIVLGHEFCGIAEKVGKDVKNVKPGDAVVVEEMGACGKCENCKNGFPNQCSNLDEAGLTYNGGFAEYSIVKAHHLWSINAMEQAFGKEKMFTAGALIEPLSVVYNGLFSHDIPVLPGSYCAVFGCGPIGLMAVSMLKAVGVSKILAFDIVEDRRQLALKAGATKAFDSSNIDIFETLMKETGGKGIDVLVEAAGVAHIVLPEASKALNCNARIVAIGMGAKPASMNITTLQQKHVKLTGSVGSAGHRNYENVIRMLAAGVIDIKPFVSGEYGLADYENAFAAAKDGKSAKILIKP